MESDIEVFVLALMLYAVELIYLAQFSTTFK